MHLLVCVVSNVPAASNIRQILLEIKEFVPTKNLYLTWDKSRADTGLMDYHLSSLYKGLPVSSCDIIYLLRILFR